MPPPGLQAALGISVANVTIQWSLPVHLARAVPESETEILGQATAHLGGKSQGPGVFRVRTPANLSVAVKQGYRA